MAVDEIEARCRHGVCRAANPSLDLCKALSVESCVDSGDESNGDKEIDMERVAMDCKRPCNLDYLIAGQSGIEVEEMGLVDYERETFTLSRQSFEYYFNFQGPTHIRLPQFT